MNLLRAIHRGSTSARLVLLLCAISILMVFVEPLVWRYEPLWGIWNYNGSLIITGPLAAGIVAWDTARSSGTGELAAVRGTSLRFILSQSLPAAAALAVSYFTGLIAVLIVLGTSGGLDSLSRTNPGIWVSILPVLAYCVVATSLGALLGAIMPRWYAAPIVAAMVYGLEVALFHAGFIGWVTVGGSAGSLVGLAPNPARYLLQTVAFIGVSAVLTTGYLLVVRRSKVNVAAFATTTSITIGALAVFAPVQSPVFQQGTTSEACESISTVEYCVPSDYKIQLNRVAAAISPWDAILRDLEQDMPRLYTGQFDADRPSGRIPTSLLLGETDSAVSMDAAITAATLGGCESWGNEHFDANRLLVDYLRSATEPLTEGLVDDRLLSDDPLIVKSAAREAIELLRTPCGQ